MDTKEFVEQIERANEHKTCARKKQIEKVKNQLAAEALELRCEEYERLLERAKMKITLLEEKAKYEAMTGERKKIEINEETRNEINEYVGLMRENKRLTDKNERLQADMALLRHKIGDMEELHLKRLQAEEKANWYEMRYKDLVSIMDGKTDEWDLGEGNEQ